MHALGKTGIQGAVRYPCHVVAGHVHGSTWTATSRSCSRSPMAPCSGAGSDPAKAQQTEAVGVSCQLRCM